MEFKQKRVQRKHWMVRVPEDHYAVLVQIAEREDTTLTEVIRKFIEIGYAVYRRENGDPDEEQ